MSLAVVGHVRAGGSRAAQRRRPPAPSRPGMLAQPDTGVPDLSAGDRGEQPTDGAPMEPPEAWVRTIPIFLFFFLW